MTESKPKVTHVLLIDDHALFRESVARALAMDPRLAIEHCASIAAALQLLAQRAFDLVLLDHDLGNERASQFLPAARQSGFTGRVLVVTAWVSTTEARRLLQQGVAGIFLKHAPLEELTASIRTVLAGEAGLTARWRGKRALSMENRTRRCSTTGSGRCFDSSSRVSPIRKSRGDCRFRRAT